MVIKGGRKDKKVKNPWVNQICENFKSGSNGFTVVDYTKRCNLSSVILIERKVFSIFYAYSLSYNHNYVTTVDNR